MFRRQEKSWDTFGKKDEYIKVLIHSLASYLGYLSAQVF